MLAATTSICEELGHFVGLVFR